MNDKFELQVILSINCKNSKFLVLIFQYKTCFFYYYQTHNHYSFLTLLAAWKLSKFEQNNYQKPSWHLPAQCQQ